MSVVFALRGNSLNAYYAPGGESPFLLNKASSNPALISNAGLTGAFGSNLIDVHEMGASKYRAIAFPGGNNINISSNQITVLMRIVPLFSGSPASAIALAQFANGGAALPNAFQFGWTAAGKLEVFIYTNTGNLGTSYTTTASVSAVANTAMDIQFSWDGTTSANAVKWSINGVQLETGTAGAAMNFTASSVSELLIGSSQVHPSNNFYIDEFLIFDVALSSTYSVRSAYYTVSGAPLQPLSSTDPGVANVRSATSYNFQGNSKTGTCVVPTAANVRSAVQVDATNGTLVVPGASSVKTGVTYDSGSSVTGTYDGSDRWTDPGNTNVKNGVQYKANSLTNNKTGTYQGNDLWSDPGEANVLNGVSYLVDGVTMTGTLQLLYNTMAQMSITQDPSTPVQALVVTQGDAITLKLLAIDDTNSHFDLTGASFSTKILNKDGSYLTIDNSHHNADPDQTGNKGKFTVFLSGTSNLKTGDTRGIITTISVNQDVIQFHGTIKVVSSEISKT